MAKTVSNPSFPHWCRVYRVTGETSFKDGEEETLYEGKCLKYGNTSLRTFTTKGVVAGDFAVDIPGLVRVRIGDLIDVEEYSGRLTRVTLTGASPSEMGTTVYFNHTSN